MTPRETKQLCKAIAACCERGEITKQQAKTLQGQAKHGHPETALAGLKTIYDRM